ncbi:hypothetical protein [uncultured Winogradskyella sp.]|uniref:hypothetical protein n=1 Tax=uncultured Winogradskyella sp. TaxID=395353 RepID=UPI0026119D26|nr:hypothetical protein [uncultured Winogradskyella sp.]
MKLSSIKINFLYRHLFLLMIVSFSLVFGCKGSNNIIKENINTEDIFLEWQKTNEEFLNRNSLSDSYLKNYMNNSFEESEYDGKKYESIKKSILDFLYSNSDIDVSTNFYFFETFSKGKLYYSVLTDKKGKNSYKVYRALGTWKIKSKNKASFNDISKRFQEALPYKKCNEDNNNMIYGIVSEFEDGSFTIKLIDLQCSGDGTEWLPN